MAETPSKRLRQEYPFDFDDSNSKRQKPYNNDILSLLDDEEDNFEQNQDLSAIFTTLEQELSSSSSSSTTAAAFEFDSPAEEDQQTGEEDEGVKSVMRHLLEASDDELGIPNYTEENNNAQIINSDENNVSLNIFDNGFWEFEDVAANYYTVLQSELFM